MELHWRTRTASFPDPEEVTHEEEVSERGYVLVSSLLTWRSGISIGLSFYRAWYELDQYFVSSFVDDAVVYLREKHTAAVPALLKREN